PEAPIQQAERISSLDVLRGFALLGILLMNIVPMGLYYRAAPSALGSATTANVWVWAILYVIAGGKMRAIFSLVFGAGIILLTARREASGRARADIYYRRHAWLLLFGIAHAYLLFFGDILYPYALCALVLYPFRKLRARGLLIAGSVVLMVNSAVYLANG